MQPQVPQRRQALSKFPGCSHCQQRTVLLHITTVWIPIWKIREDFSWRNNTKIESWKDENGLSDEGEEKTNPETGVPTATVLSQKRMWHVWRKQNSMELTEDSVPSMWSLAKLLKLLKCCLSFSLGLLLSISYQMARETFRKCKPHGAINSTVVLHCPHSKDQTSPTTHRILQFPSLCRPSPPGPVIQLMSLERSPVCSPAYVCANCYFFYLKCLCQPGKLPLRLYGTHALYSLSRGQQTIAISQIQLSAHEWFCRFFRS